MPRSRRYRAIAINWLCLLHPHGKTPPLQGLRKLSLFIAVGAFLMPALVTESAPRGSDVVAPDASADSTTAAIASDVSEGIHSSGRVDGAAVIIPDATDLPSGLEFSRRSGWGLVSASGSVIEIEGESVHFVGDNSIAVDVLVHEKLSSGRSFHRGRVIQAVFGPIYLLNTAGPWEALWTGPGFQYSLHAYTPPYPDKAPAWSEADLAAFAEALVAAQQ